uniref:Nuclear receptor domain-containing protein n=1 Tax=Panagrolaimus davidi TaxID=227884 RepID=A0A914PPE6_9BILA
MCDQSNTVPCLICTKGIPVGSRRFGAQCCGSCAAFFTRSIPDQDAFECENGTNECLKGWFFILKNME